jgi:hypothetical protein
MSVFIEQPIDLKIARAPSRIDGSQIPDMPDRIIAATAVHLGIPSSAKIVVSDFPG